MGLCRCHYHVRGHSYSGPRFGTELTYLTLWIPLPDRNPAYSRKSEREAFEETKFTTTEVHVDTSGSNLAFVKPGTLLQQDKPGGNPVHPFVRAVSLSADEM